MNEIELRRNIWFGRSQRESRMNRRDFILSTAVGAVLAREDTRPPEVVSGRKRALMKLGCQSGPTSDGRLQFFARHGVKNICGIPETKGKDPTIDELLQMKERAARWDISVDMLTPPFLASSHVDRTERPSIMLGQSPERDRDIESFQNLIRNCAQAGIPAIKYNMSILGVLRTGRTQGRGAVGYSTWRLHEAKPRSVLTRAGRVTADIYWERITYFLKHVVPVANEYKIRLACHPHDPGV
ncbi:MAG TPA: mannonate dehydratase, partial [Verrucomicrobiae bacterium]|nr:mannonate dehydratase [Verrucomicrobiae bacterium]